MRLRLPFRCPHYLDRLDEPNAGIWELRAPPCRVASSRPGQTGMPKQSVLSIPNAIHGASHRCPTSWGNRPRPSMLGASPAAQSSWASHAVTTVLSQFAFVRRQPPSPWARDAIVEGRERLFNECAERAGDRDGRWHRIACSQAPFVVGVCGTTEAVQPRRVQVQPRTRTIVGSAALANTRKPRGGQRPCSRPRQCASVQHRGKHRPAGYRSASWNTAGEMPFAEICCAPPLSGHAPPVRWLQRPERVSPAGPPSRPLRLPPTPPSHP